MLLMLPVAALLLTLPIASIVQSVRYARQTGWSRLGVVGAGVIGWLLWWVILPVYIVWAIRYDWQRRAEPKWRPHTVLAWFGLGVLLALAGVVVVASLRDSTPSRPGPSSLCEEAVSLAKRHKTEALNVTPEPVAPIPTGSTPDDAMFARIEEDRLQASASAAAHARGRDHLRLYIAVVGQNPACFSVEERAQAEVYRGWFD